MICWNYYIELLIKFEFIWKKMLFWGKIQLKFQYRQMKLRTHHLIQRSWKTRFRCRWKNPLHFQIQTQTLIQFRIPNLRCWRLRCDFGPGIHLLYWPLCGHLQQCVIFGRTSGSSRDLTKTRWTTKVTHLLFKLVHRPGW